MVDGLVKMALGLGLPADATHGGAFLDNLEGWYLPARVMELTISWQPLSELVVFVIPSGDEIFLFQMSSEEVLDAFLAGYNLE